MVRIPNDFSSENRKRCSLCNPMVPSKILKISRPSQKVHPI
ncbi:unnamed protein product [Staurois parvus]|uniref:Uncharacterized protein n=1 Tax=Staurois parvus TaxID=386267 RepID=A0ABN9C862_9NEOB|nr:unnamed protein product [Staurois parvus]